MKYFVSGGTGYLGTRIISRLIERGDYVFCVIRDTSDITGLPTEGVTYVKNSMDAIERVFEEEQFDWVLNMACSYFQGAVLYNDVLEANIEFPLKILNIAVRNKVHNFLTIGTGLPDNFNMYSFSKKILSDFGNFYQNKHNINFCTLKLEMFYGEHEPKNRFIPSCIQKIYHNEPVPLTVGTQKRDIIYIDDVCDAIMFILDRGIVGYQVIPVGTGESPTVREVVCYIHELLHSKSELQFGAVPLRADEPDCVADISLLSSMGFQVRYHWKEGLKKMLKEEELL